MTAPLRIAIADDDRSTREILRRLIDELGHTVVIDVDSGRALIEQCRAAPPDIVITDNVMGDMSGLEAALEIYRLRPLPIVLLSGFCDPKLVRTAEERHILVYLVKPISRDHLEVALARCIDQLAAAQKNAEPSEVHFESTERSGVDSRLRTTGTRPEKLPSSR